MNSEGASLWLVAATLPLLLVCATCFAKLSVVFGALRAGLGTQDLPSGTVVTALAGVVSLAVMLPLLSDLWPAVTQPLTVPPGALPARVPDPLGGTALSRFWELNAGEAELRLFAELTGLRPGAPQVLPARAVLAAFALTELREAFVMAFAVLVPFVVLDLVTAATLATVGLNGLSAQAVSLPFKLLLFVSVGGWVALTGNMVASYQLPMAGAP